MGAKNGDCCQLRKYKEGDRSEESNFDGSEERIIRIEKNIRAIRNKSDIR
jgi:hypothetical protein